MFPVLIDLENRDGLLRPGMNADVEVMVADRNQVLAIPNATLRTQGDVYSGASVLGYTVEDVDKMLAASPKPENRKWLEVAVRLLLRRRAISPMKNA